jgi:DNA helicase-2/ATP-dependent DNA helicase PcrA
MNTISSELNEAQRAAVTAGFEPLLIVAGAGTGKTRTLTERIKHLIAHGTPPERIYAVTFTNKAAKEMASRVHASGRGVAPFIGTFHSLGVRLLRDDAKKLGRTANFVIFDDHDTMQLLRRLLKGNETAKQLKRGPAFFREAISSIKGGLTPETLAEHFTRAEATLVHDVYNAYETALRENNGFDFDDLIEKPVQLFREHPDALQKQRDRLGYLFVDEYQDINAMQRELIRLLVGTHAHLSVVGDDQQTIYSWRGSSVETFLAFEEDWPNARVVLLEENYRSTKTILQAANAVIANNTRQKPKRLFTGNADGDVITVFEALNEDTEAMWIAERVKEIAATPVPKPAQRSTIGILYRTNAQSRAVEQALIMHGVPYVMYGGVQFYERREVKDVVAALRIAVNPQDTLSVERLQKALRKAPFLAAMDVLRTATGRPPTEVIKDFLIAAHYIEYLEKEFLNAPERLENVNELLRFSTEFTETAPFLEQVSLMQSTDRGTARGRTTRAEHPVALMTMHMAKGLEFDTVFIAGVQEGILPHQRSLDTLAELEEERRLFYVAMTRARKKLNISFSDIPSRFLFEIPEDYTKFTSERTAEDALVDDEERYITID